MLSQPVMPKGPNTDIRARGAVADSDDVEAAGTVPHPRRVVVAGGRGGAGASVRATDRRHTGLRAAHPQYLDRPSPASETPMQSRRPLPPVISETVTPPPHCVAERCHVVARLPRH